MCLRPSNSRNCCANIASALGGEAIDAGAAESHGTGSLQANKDSTLPCDAGDNPTQITDRSRGTIG